MKIILLVCVIIGTITLVECGTIMVPAYFYPTTSGGVCTDSKFVELASYGSCVIAIVNPNNGPGSTLNTDYDICLNYISSHRNRVFGYIYSGYGSRALDDIQADIDTWNNLYGNYLSGIFVDETVTFWQLDETNENLYDNIFAYIKTKNVNWEIIINPGSVSPVEFFDGVNIDVDYAVMFENTYEAYDPATALSNPTASCLDYLRDTSQGTFGPGPWCPLVPNFDGADFVVNGVRDGVYSPTRFVTLIYDATTYSSSAWTDSINAGLDVFFMTDDTLTNPWDSLPSYFSEMADDVCVDTYANFSSYQFSRESTDSESDVEPSTITFTIDVSSFTLSDELKEQEWFFEENSSSLLTMSYLIMLLLPFLI